MLSFTDQIKPFETPGKVYHIAVNITDPNTAQQKTALVNIDWELTAEQNKIYEFYTNDLPQYIEDSYRYQEQYYQIGKLYEQLWTKKWPANKEKTLSWQTFAKKVKNNIKRLIPDDLKIKTATQVGINFLNVGQCQTLETSPFYLQVGQIEFDLPYYAYSQTYPSPSEQHPSILPKITKWQVGYNNDYNIMQELKKDQTLWSIAEPNTTTTQASSQYNKQQINEKLTESSTTGDYNYLTNTDAMSYKGTLQAVRFLSNPILNQIEVYFHDVDQNFKIVVEADYL